MKKQLMSFVSTTLSGKFFATAIVALMLAGPVSANNGTPDPGVKNAVIKHISTSDETILFEVKFANEKGEKFTVVIKDESGAMLYRGVYSDKEFSKKFQLPRTDNNKLFFVIKTASGDKSESFKIDSNTRLVEEVVVTRVM